MMSIDTIVKACFARQKCLASSLSILLPTSGHNANGIWLASIAKQHRRPSLWLTTIVTHYC